MVRLWYRRSTKPSNPKLERGKWNYSNMDARQIVLRVLPEVTTRMKRAYNITFVILTLSVILAFVAMNVQFPVAFIVWLQPLFFTFLIGTALLVWTLVPGNRRAKVYLIFIVFPLASITPPALFLTSISTFPPWPVNLEPEIVAAAIDIGSGLLTIAALSSLAAAMALRTFLAKKAKTPLLYVTVALIALGIPTVLIFLMYPSTIIFAPGYLIVLSPMLGTVLIGTLEYPVQHIAVGVLVLIMVIIVGGWVRVEMIDDGLDAFTGQEREEAKQALRLEGCFVDLGQPSPPPMLRVVKGDGGEFRVLGYTWWGLPSGERSCGAYRQWNRW